MDHTRKPLGIRPFIVADYPGLDVDAAVHEWLAKFDQACKAQQYETQLRCSACERPEPESTLATGLMPPDDDTYADGWRDYSGSRPKD